MSFETPAAFWGLLSLLLLAIFSLWRQAAVRTVVPSLLLWKRIPERNPPLRALRRPHWRLELLLQALAIAAIVAALAGPYVETSEPEPRTVALVFDTSARLQAEGRIGRMKEAGRRLAERLAGDEVVVYAAVPAPRRISGIDEVRAVQAHVDSAALLAAARLEAEEIVYFSDREPPEGVRAALFGASGRNVGIEEFSVTDGEVFARIVNHGEARKVPLRLSCDGKTREETTVDLPAGRFSWHLRGDYSGMKRIELALEMKDHFPPDDDVVAVRLGPPRAVVSVAGRHHPLLERALESVPGVMVRRGSGRALVSVGLDEEPPPASLRVWIRSPAEPKVPELFALEQHPLTREMRAEDLPASGRLTLPGARPLIRADGAVAAALEGRVVHLAFEMAPRGWPATPSFPIFWQNVVDFAREGAGAFEVIRTGRAHALPGNVVEVIPEESGAVGTYTPSGGFLTYSMGWFKAGGGRIRANLLDGRESDTAGVTRALDWDPGDPTGRVMMRRGLGGWFAAAALALVLLAWLLQRRNPN